LNRLGRQAEKIAIQAAENVYGGGVTVDVLLEEGSLKTWVSITGALAIYGAIANYKGFKESVAEMCKDAREYSVDVCGAFAQAAKVNPGQVFRVERRLKTPGKLSRVLKKLEQLDKAAETMGTDKLQAQIREVQDELVAVQSELTEALVFENLPMIRERPRNRRPEQFKVALKPEEEYEPMLLQLDNSVDSSKVRPSEKKMVFHQKVYVPARTAGRRRLKDGVTPLKAIEHDQS
jgi:hypothetical protein